MTTVADLSSLKESIEKILEVVLSASKEDSEMDEVDLDAEAIRITSLHAKWLDFYTYNKSTASKLSSSQKKLILERWKYYNGKQTDEYYAAHGFLHEKILKTDLDKYLEADSVLTEMKEIVNMQYQIVDCAERMLKELNSRGFNIKNAIEWRRFQAGA